MTTLGQIDRSLLLALNHAAAGHQVGALLRDALALGAHGALWLVLLTLVFLFGGRQGRRLAVTGLLALGLAAVLAELVLRGLVQRIAPAAALGSVLHVVGTSSVQYSFPSAVGALAFAAATLLARLGPGWAVISWLLAIVLAAAPVAAGHCFPSDALGAWVTGALSARLAIWALGEPLARRPRRPVRSSAERAGPGPG